MAQDSAFEKGEARATCEDLLKDSLAAIAHASYLTVEDAVANGAAEEMVRLEITFSGGHSLYEVQTEIRSLWRSRVVRGKPSLHLVRVNEGGFEFLFSILDRGLSLTGAYFVKIAG